METIGEVERHGAFGQINNVAFGRVDEDLVGKKIEPKLLFVDFFARSEFGSGFLEIFNPEQVGGKLIDATLGIGGSKFLFVIEEGGGKTAFGVIVHFAGANLEFDNLFVIGNNGGME